MNTLPFLRASLLVLAFGSALAAEATETVYTGLSAWNAAVTGVAVDNFTGIAAASSVFSGTVATANATYSGLNMQVVDPAYSPTYYGWSDGNPTAMTYLNTVMVVTPKTPTRAFGVFLSSIVDYASPFTITLSNGDTFSSGSLSYPNLQFWGFTSTSAIASISLTATAGWTQIHGARFATPQSVPEPAPFAALGIGSLAWLRRRDRV